LKLPTDYPRNYLIGYEDFEEMFNDYLHINKQMEVVKEYNDDLDYDISMSIGDMEYILNITLWKI